MKPFLFFFLFLLNAPASFSQTGWRMVNSPAFTNRVDDLFMVNTQTGYAVSGDGRIVKTTDGGENWIQQIHNASVYCRSVEFVNTQKGFVGSFPLASNTSYTNVLRRTTDGGNTWTDISSELPLFIRRGGICGLSAPDSNTIYGGGNWFQDSPYIIKSSDGGNSWGFTDMSSFATSIIDLHFISKDTGFATGKGPLPLESAVILYTTDGGSTWSTKFENNIPNEYCWKIQRLTKQIWFASIEDMTPVPPRILKSVDGGMNWTVHQVATTPYNIEGIGFIDPQLGWTGGGYGWSFESRDSGITWDTVHICPSMNRVFKVNDTLMLASGMSIWKYRGKSIYPPIPEKRFAWMTVSPNPVNEQLSINISTAVSTQVMIMVFDGLGRRVKVIDNKTRPQGSYQFYYNTRSLPPGIYYVVLKTHEEKKTEKVVVNH